MQRYKPNDVYILNDPPLNNSKNKRDSKYALLVSISPKISFYLEKQIFPELGFNGILIKKKNYSFLDMDRYVIIQSIETKEIKMGVVEGQLIKEDLNSLIMEVEKDKNLIIQDKTHILLNLKKYLIN